VLEQARSGSPAQYVQNPLMDLYAVTYWLKVPKRDGTMSLIGMIMSMVVPRVRSEQLRCRTVRLGRDLRLVSQP
jgi:hypothetical protein